MKENPCAFGPVLVEMRTRLGVSQYELARRSGLSERHLNYLEHGKREPRPSTIILIARALGIRPGLLLDAMAERLVMEQGESKGERRARVAGNTPGLWSVPCFRVEK